LQVDECLKCVNFLNEKLESGVDPNSAEIKVTISAAPLIILYDSGIDDYRDGRLDRTVLEFFAKF
jgi:hypothetical protein